MAMILCGVIARGSHVLAEYDQSDANDDLCEFARDVIPKLTATASHKIHVMRGYVFNYMIENGLTFLCITEDGVKDGNQLAYTFLRSLKVNVSQSRDSSATGLTELLRLEMSRYQKNSKTKIGQMEEELTEVADLMKQNIESVMERGEGIACLMEKTNLLRNEASSFRSAARSHANAAYWNQIKHKAYVGIGVFLLILFFMFTSCGSNLCIFKKSG